ncbi:hypothetical protein DLH72_02735 [Candidatus Gracilibacteria bacterium]|nr:MAG: hypothetical protein DLH72_02735 [Candidatus Gracilibacteria bacterium]
MKKLLLSVFLSLFIFSNSFANSKQEELKLYKAIIVSKNKIEKDFTDGKIYNKAIDNLFTELRISRNKTKIDDLERRLTNAISKFSGKTYMTAKEDREYNLVLNLYYRTKLLKEYILKGNYSTQNNNSSSSSSSDRPSILDIINNNQSNNTKKGSLAFNYTIPNGWKEQEISKGETVLYDGNNRNDLNSVSFLITNYDKYPSFYSFREDYKKELSKSNSVRNLSSYISKIDGKNSYVYTYNLTNGNEKEIHLVDYNNMLLVINITKKYRNTSNKDINTIIDSIKISDSIANLENSSKKDKPSASDIIKENNKITNNNSSGSNTSSSRYLSYSYQIPNGWSEYKTGKNGETVLYNGRNTGDKDSVSFIISDYDRYSSFYNFKEDYKNELLKMNSVRNFRDYSSSIDGKDSYVFEYSLNNGDEKQVILADYNNLTLVINITKRTNNSTNEIKEIINSVRINK